MEEFAEPELEVTTDEDIKTDDIEKNGEEDSVTDLEELIEQSHEKIREAKGQLFKVKSQLNGLNDELLALQEKQQAEIKIISETWDGTKQELNTLFKSIKDDFSQQIKDLKEVHKGKKKQLGAELKQLEKEIPQAEYDSKLLTNKGKLQLVLDDADLIQKLADRYIDAEVARRLDYTIFMAVSEQGGKNNSGDYEYLLDTDGNLIEDNNGNPVYNQDLVNYSITKEMLAGQTDLTQELGIAAEKVSYNIQPGIAEAFIQFAKEQRFNFWRD